MNSDQFKKDRTRDVLKLVKSKLPNLKIILELSNRDKLQSSIQSLDTFLMTEQGLEEVKPAMISIWLSKYAEKSISNIPSTMGKIVEEVKAGYKGRKVPNIESMLGMTISSTHEFQVSETDSSSAYLNGDVIESIKGLGKIFSISFPNTPSEYDQAIDEIGSPDDDGSKTLANEKAAMESVHAKLLALFP